jgi:GNAT superfamily N-acetyltransferase
MEMKSVSDLNPKEGTEGMQLVECEFKQWQYNKFLYQFVGEPWEWIDRLKWSAEQWKEYAEDDNLRTWVAYVQGSPAGYFELQRQDGGDVEIVLFGLAKSFIGRGLGGDFLSRALDVAWSWEGTARVWLHTCTLDHRNALKNYEARGMTVYRVDTDEQDE